MSVYKVIVGLGKFEYVCHNNIFAKNSIEAIEKVLSIHEHNCTIIRVIKLDGFGNERSDTK